MRYLADHIATAIEATSPGGAAESVDLRGYYVWSLMDNFEWSGGYKQQFGLLHVDRETQERTKKASFHWLREVLAARHRNSVPERSGRRNAPVTVRRRAGRVRRRPPSAGRLRRGSGGRPGRRLENPQALQAFRHACAVRGVDPRNIGTGVVPGLRVAAGQDGFAGGELADADGGHPVAVLLGEV